MSDLKKLFLIRHAESLENERLACLTRSLSGLSRLSLPSASDLRRSVELINVSAQVDSAVSDVGRDQINQVGGRLRADNFLTKNNVQLVAHSPLLRARQTSEGMLGCVAAPFGSDESHTVTAPVKRVEELSCLEEKHPSEWIPGNFGAFAKRMADFEAWVCDQPENTMAIVGHSQFFKAMLELDYKFSNCDVWEVTIDCAKVSGGSRCEVEPERSSDDESEEKKDDTKIMAGSSKYPEADYKPLPRGWMDLKILYKYEKKTEKEEA